MAGGGILFKMAHRSKAVSAERAGKPELRSLLANGAVRSPDGGILPVVLSMLCRDSVRLYAWPWLPCRSERGDCGVLGRPTRRRGQPSGLVEIEHQPLRSLADRHHAAAEFGSQKRAIEVHPGLVINRLAIDGRHVSIVGIHG